MTRGLLYNVYGVKSSVTRYLPPEWAVCDSRAAITCTLRCAGDNHSGAGGPQRAGAGAAAVRAVPAERGLAGHAQGVGHGQRAVRADHAAGPQGAHHGHPSVGGQLPTHLLTVSIQHT